jgi:hypothetical protein
MARGDRGAAKAKAAAEKANKTRQGGKGDKELEARASGHGKPLTKAEVKALKSRGNYGEGKDHDTF